MEKVDQINHAVIELWKRQSRDDKEANMPKDESKRIFCNLCHRETNHKLESEHTKIEEYKDVASGDMEPPFEIHIDRLWRCAGCESWTMEEQDGLFLAGEIPLEEQEQFLESPQYYPERNFSIKLAKQFKHLPEKLEVIYQETLRAYNARSNLLCAVGIRTLIEGIAAQKRARGRNLEEKIDNLKDLPPNIVIGIHKIRFIGNKAAHELNSPEESELELAIEICEDLMNFFYELIYKAKRLKKPRRRQTVLRNVRPSSIQQADEKDEP